jgi:hypothetical protein
VPLLLRSSARIGPASNRTAPLGAEIFPANGKARAWLARRADQIRCRFFTSDKITNQLSPLRDIVLCPHRPVFCFAGNMKEHRAALPSFCRVFVVFTPNFPSLRQQRRNIKSLGFQSRNTVCTSTIVRPILPARSSIHLSPDWSWCCMIAAVYHTLLLSFFAP